MRIRIRVQVGLNYPENRNTKKEEAYFFELLDVLFRGLEASPVAWILSKEA
jgi:hypothetical protein